MPEHPLGFLDCSCGLGAWPGGPPVTAPALLARLDALGMAGACVYSLAAESGEVAQRNLDLAAAVRGNPRLYPVWTVGPHQCGEFPPPAEVPPVGEPPAPETPLDPGTPLDAATEGGGGGGEPAAATKGPEGG